MLLDFLGAFLLPHFDEGGSGGSGGTDSKDDKGDDKNDDGKEETITLKKSEYEAKLQQKFAEGARKASTSGADDKSKDVQKTDTGQKTEGKTDAVVDDLNAVKAELEMLRGEKQALKQGIKPEYAEDAVALLKGKGLAINEENMKAIVEKHPEWKTSNDANGTNNVVALGSTGGKTTPAKVDEAEQAAKMFGI